MSGAKHLIVAISREAGSGGRKIGKLLAEKLGWNLYDKELLNMTGEETGFAPEVVAQVEHAHSSMFSISLGRTLGDFENDYYYSNTPLNEQLFNAQSKLICGIADRENAVIVGRCADSVLADYAPVVSVFIQGTTERRLQRIIKRENLSRADAEKRMKLIDKTRTTYHDYFSLTKWGKRENYDLVINSDVGEEAAAETIATYVKALLQNKDAL